MALDHQLPAGPQGAVPVRGSYRAAATPHARAGDGTMGADDDWQLDGLVLAAAPLAASSMPGRAHAGVAPLLLPLALGYAGQGAEGVWVGVGGVEWVRTGERT